MGPGARRKTALATLVAFVLVSHLDPNHASILTEILQRSTSMPVVEVEDKMTVVPNSVYVIPPNRDMTIFHGKLHLSEPQEKRGLRLPIDGFLRSLADDQNENAIGIILSGTGTDGTLGLRAILGAGGVSMVQDPSTAKYDGMPVSAIQAGYARHVLPVEKMPKVLLDGTHILAVHHEISPLPVSVINMNNILRMLRSGTGHDFSSYKKSTISRRIEQRMSQHNIENTEIYARYLKENPAEIKLLFKELLINVTCFFRDKEAFVTLKQDILPLMFENKPEDLVLRVWVAGCASGEETYSIAMVLREFMDETGQEFNIQIYSTDLDDNALTIARAGIFPPNISQDVDSGRLQRFFVKEESGYRIKKDIREMVVFATHNLIKDPPFSRLDLLSCRNVMIYLEHELKSRLISAFHYALRPGGVLFLSPSESIGNHIGLFVPINRKWKFFRSTDTAISTSSVLSSRLLWSKNSKQTMPVEVTKKYIRHTNLAELTNKTLVETFAPAAVVTDLQGNILYVHGDTAKYLRPAPGQATLNVVNMASDGLQLELRTLMNNADQVNSSISREISFVSNGNLNAVKISLYPIIDSVASAKLILISFQELDYLKPGKLGRTKVAASKNNQLQRIKELEHQLSYAKQNLQANVDDQQASKEDLQTTNEELQSTNEELQSTNEELETSKEELQSVNEELITVNAELQSKIEQLFGIQSDMKNLIDNINGGTIFLDGHFNIKRFTREATQIYRLVASDLGRRLCDIKSNIQDENLLAEAQTVLESLKPHEQEVRTISGEWYLARIQPYRSLENVINGVVLTFTDITARIAAEAAEKFALKLAEGIVDTVREPLIVLDENLKIISASKSFYRDFQTTPEDTVGRPILSFGNHQWNIPKLRELLENILPNNQSFEGYEVDHNFPDCGHQRMLISGRKIIDNTGETKRILLAMEKIS